MNQWMEDGVLEYLKECMEDFMDPEMFGFAKPKKAVGGHCRMQQSH
jgi:hypothetical protein